MPQHKSVKEKAARKQRASRRESFVCSEWVCPKAKAGARQRENAGSEMGMVYEIVCDTVLQRGQIPIIDVTVDSCDGMII